jgi:hypothetical protein
MQTTIYVLVSEGVEIGQASGLIGLQKLHDHVMDLAVQKIRNPKDVDIIAKVVDADGIYIRPFASRPDLMKYIRNKHRDFFQYHSAYKRDLYADRKIDTQLTEILVDAVEKRRTLQERVVQMQKAWFEEQVEKGGGGVHITKYPVWEETAELSALNERVADALQLLERGSH